MVLAVAAGQASQQRALDAWRAGIVPATDAQSDPVLSGSRGRRFAAIVESGLLPLQADGVDIHRLGPGCLCCVGIVPLRATLTRVLARRPAGVLVLIATADHLSTLRRQLADGDLGARFQVDVLEVSDP